MKGYEVYKSIRRVSSLRPVAIVFYCVALCFLCVCCRTTRSVSQSSTTERHEVFDNKTASDTLDLTGSVVQSDTASVSINETSNDTIKIQRDEAGRPILIIWNHDANLLGAFKNSKLSNLDFTGFHTSGRNKSTGTVDDLDQKKEESKTEIDPSLPLEKIIGLILIGLAILYVIYVIIADGVWPHLKKSIFSRLSNK